MKGLSTLLFGGLGVVALCGFFALTSVLVYATSPVAMTATARESGLYGMTLEAVDRTLQGDLQQEVEPLFEGYVLARVGAAVGAAVSEEWFYGALTGVLRDLVHLVTGDGPPPRPVALQAVQRGLQDGLLGIGREVRADCARLTRSPVCADRDTMEELIRGYEREVVAVTGRIPAELDLDRLAADAGLDWLAADSAALRGAKQGYLWIRIARWGCLGLAMLALVMLTSIHAASLSRLLTVLGVVVALAAGGYLIAAWLAGDVVAGMVGAAGIEARLAVSDRSPAVVSIAAAGAEALARHGTRDALRAADLAVWILLAAGGGSVAGGWILRRQPRARSR